MIEWQPIETAPKDKLLLLWWRPIDGNIYAESCVIGQISSSEKEKWWGDGRYQEVWHITHWMELPKGPSTKEMK